MYIRVTDSLPALTSLLCVIITALCASPARAQTEPALWDQLKRGGYYILLRHAQTEAGSGDPPNYVLEDCATQRNLSEAGRAQAAALGEHFRALNVPIAQVLSSQFCRCLDTARIAFGRVEAWPALNSIFETSPQNDARIEALKQRLGVALGASNVLLVSHNVNINATTGIAPAAGEFVVVAPDGRGAFSVLGRGSVPHE